MDLLGDFVKNSNEYDATSGFQGTVSDCSLRFIQLWSTSDQLVRSFFL